LTWDEGAAMSCEQETAAALREAGQKVTPQRILVLSCLRHANHHITAAEVLERVRATYPYIDASTVYRTLASAKELRLVSDTRIGAGDTEFEWIGGEKHHHLICRVCGTATSLDSRYLDSVAAALVDETGFQADLDHFAIFGICKDCRAKQKA
jgi:Fur family ferric uptake transcriptional regulator